MAGDARQAEQARRHEAWVINEGYLEHPVQLATYLQPLQQARIAWIKRHIVGKALDVGCSWGYTTVTIGAVAGCDINPELIGIAKQLSRDTSFFVADATNLPMPDKTFDTVVLAEVLEHLPWETVHDALDEAKRLSKRRILITVPDGVEDTDEATCFKHHYLITKEKLESIQSAFQQYRTTMAPPFVYVVGLRW